MESTPPPEAAGNSSASEGPVLTRYAYLSMLASAAGFATMATLVGQVTQLQPSLSSTMVSTVRAAVNLLVLVLFAWRNPLRLFGDRRPSLWLRGVFGAMSLLTYFAALSRVSVGEAAFLNQTSAVWVAVLAPVLLKEKGSRWSWAAIAGSMVGVLLLSFPREGVTSTWMGRMMGVASGFFAACAYVSVRRAGASNPPTVIVFYFTLVSTAACGLLLSLEPVVWPQGTTVWAALVGIGVCATIAQIFMTRAYRSGPATEISVVAYAGPLITSLLGWLVLRQVPDAPGLLGMALILICGVTLPYLFSQR